MSFRKKLIGKILSKLQNILDANNRMNVTECSHISAKAVIRGATLRGNLKIEENVKLLGGVILNGESLISIGRYTSINGPFTDVRSIVNPVKIGAFTSIARGVTIQEFNHKFDTVSSYYFNQNIFSGDKKEDVYSNGEIIIGNDVWIGTQCVILSGARIGNGAIVAANSVVKGEIPPYSIVGGSPAKVIKFRFEQEVIQQLLALQWWNWPIEKIRDNKTFFTEKLNASFFQNIR